MKLLRSLFLLLALGCAAASSSSSAPQSTVILPDTVEAKRCKRDCDAEFNRCKVGSAFFDVCDGRRNNCLESCPGATVLGGESDKPKEPPPPPE